jgi:hypothetical protein
MEMISKDFLVKNGIVVSTTATIYSITNSVSTTTGALIVRGGAGIGGNLFLSNAQIINNGVGSSSQASGQTLVITNGGIGIRGKSYFENNVTIASTQTSTSSYSANALYVAGGIGASGGFNIQGDSYLRGDLYITGMITGTNVSLNTLIANSGTFYGDSTGAGALYAGITGYTPFGQTVIQAAGDLNNYMEFNLQNINAGAQASTDIVASADDVTESGAFIDMGITSSQWDGTQAVSLGTALKANDGYVLVGNNATAGLGSLVLGTITTGTQIKFVVAAATATVTDSMTAVIVNPQGTPADPATLDGTLVVKGGVAVDGGIYSTGTVTADSIVATATTPSNSTTSGALVVAGGAAVGGDLHVGGTIYGTISGTLITSSVNTATNAQNIQIKNASTGPQYYIALAESKNNTFSPLDATAALVYDSATNQLTVPSARASSLVVDNNVNIGGTLNIAGDMATITLLGYNGVSFLVDGVHNFVGGEPVIPQTSGLGLTAHATYYVSAVFSTSRVVLSTTPYGSGVGTVGTQSILAYTGESPSLRVTATTTSTSPTTGAVVIDGGVGIGGDLYVAGHIYGSDGIRIITGITSTTSPTPPVSPPPAVGDIWYNSITDVIYRYTLDGSNNLYWLDITGPSVLPHLT